MRPPCVVCHRLADITITLRGEPIDLCDRHYSTLPSINGLGRLSAVRVG